MYSSRTRNAGLRYTFEEHRTRCLAIRGFRLQKATHEAYDCLAPFSYTTKDSSRIHSCSAKRARAPRMRVYVYIYMHIYKVFSLIVTAIPFGVWSFIELFAYTPAARTFSDSKLYTTRIRGYN